MTIDLERLAVDADYWDEVAPEGATHFMHTEKFVKWVFGVEWVFYASSGREWKKTHCNWMLKQYLNDGTFVLAKADVPKPHPTDTQPAESEAKIPAEWDGEGLPPVGTECELACSVQVSFEDKAIVTYVPEGTRVEINGSANFGHNEVRVFSSAIDGAWFVGFHKEFAFRPIRSHAERERDDLARALLDDLDALELNISGRTATRIADGIIAAGWCKEGLA
jgi:hypothetical protein